MGAKRREAVESEMKQKRMSTRPGTGAEGKRGGWRVGSWRRLGQGAKQQAETETGTETGTETVERSSSLDT